MGKVSFSVDIKILSPGGYLPLPWGYKHVLNHEKNCIKSDFKDIFFKLATNEWSDKYISVDIRTLSRGGCLPLPRAIYMYKIMKRNFL